MRGPAGWVSVGMLVGVLVGFVLGRLPGHSPAPVAQLRQQQAAAARRAYADHPDRPQLVRLIRALLQERDAQLAAQEDAPDRYEAPPEILELLRKLDRCSETPAEREEFRRLNVHALGWR